MLHKGCKAKLELFAKRKKSRRPLTLGIRGKQLQMGDAEVPEQHRATRVMHMQLY